MPDDRACYRAISHPAVGFHIFRVCNAMPSRTATLARVANFPSGLLTRLSWYRSRRAGLYVPREPVDRVPVSIRVEKWYDRDHRTFLGVASRIL